MEGLAEGTSSFTLQKLPSDSNSRLDEVRMTSRDIKTENWRAKKEKIDLQGLPARQAHIYKRIPAKI